MNAKQFLINFRQMCNTYGTCANCPLHDAKTKAKNVMCLTFLKEHPQESVNIVRDFVNNRQTRQQLYLKLFPNNTFTIENGVLSACPNHVRGLLGCEHSGEYCKECKRNFWWVEIK